MPTYFNKNLQSGYFKKGWGTIDKLIGGQKFHSHVITSPQHTNLYEIGEKQHSNMLEKAR
jgi:hypothetical protein